LRLIYTSQFKKDFKKIKSRGKDISQLESIINKILNKEPLDIKFRDHKLSGRWKDFHDCHIEPDWILIYRVTESALYLERTGSHSNLFR
jgi:mRNA interferase YafQ